MEKGYSIVARMTQAEFDAGAHSTLVATRIEIIDGNGIPTGVVYEKGAPLMTKAQRLALTPVEGLEVFQTDNGAGKYQYIGTSWQKLSNLALAHFGHYVEGTQLVTNIGTNLVTYPLNVEHNTILNNITFSDINDTLTVISEGVYKITFIEHSSSGALGNWGHITHIYKNGVSIARGTSSNDSTLRISITTEYVGALVAGDVISFKVRGINATSDISGGQITVEQIS